jgi:hypothetical protein
LINVTVWPYVYTSPSASRRAGEASLHINTRHSSHPHTVRAVLAGTTPLPLRHLLPHARASRPAQWHTQVCTQRANIGAHFQGQPPNSQTVSFDRIGKAFVMGGFDPPSHHHSQTTHQRHRCLEGGDHHLIRSRAEGVSWMLLALCHAPCPPLPASGKSPSHSGFSSAVP